MARIWYEKAKDSADYLFESAELFTGTNAEIDKIMHERYDHMQNKETLEKCDLSKYWYDGEILVMRIVENKLIIKPHYGN